MSNKNIFQQRIRPVLPKILQEERVFVYVPKATDSSAGIAYFPDEEFTIGIDGKVILKWPLSMQIENSNINNPLQTMARVKVNEDEFVNTNERVIITHPSTKRSYSNTKSAIKFKRTGQNVFKKPGFIMIDENDFESEEIDSYDEQDPGRYIKYKLKYNNPLDKPSLIRVNNIDFNYNNELSIKWPYAHEPVIGNKTNDYGLIKIKPNSGGYLKFTNGYLELDTNKLKEDRNIEHEIIPIYGGKNNGFNDYDKYVDNKGYAKQDTEHNLILKLTKDAVGLNKVENKYFSEYNFNDFGSEMQNHFTEAFNEKVDIKNWDMLFNDWNEPVGKTVQKVVNDLRLEDKSIRDTIKINSSFLGFFESVQELKNNYQANKNILHSTAYLINTSSYWKVSVNNVNKIVEDRVPTSSDIPNELLKTSIGYKIGRRDTQEIYQWNGSNFVLITDKLNWIDVILDTDKEVKEYIKDNNIIINNFKIACKETNKIFVYNNNWIEDGIINYQWINCYIDLAWSSFIETDVSKLKPNGIANIGTSGKWLSSDHVHPTDNTRLSKDIFDNTNIEVHSIYNNNNKDDFKVSFTNGGYKILNIPHIRLSKSIYNWNGKNTFIDSEEAEEYYWSGMLDEFVAQEEYIKNKSLIVIDDDEQYIPEDLLQVQDLENSGISIKENSNDRFVITNINDVYNLLDTPITIKEVNIDNKVKYMIRNILPLNTKSGRLIITNVINDKPTITTYSPINALQPTLISLDSNGNLTELIEAKYLKTDTILKAGKIVVSTDDGRNVKSITSIDNIEGGIIVADGNGAIKSTSFTKAGKLLQTSGINGEKLAAEIDVNNLVMAEPFEFNESGIVVSNTVGGIRRQNLGLLSDKLIVTDGANGLKVQTLNNESLVYVDNTGKIIAFPTTTNDAGKALIVQSNGKIGIQNLPAPPTHLPITTLGNVTTGTKLSFGETSVFEEGVLYLW